MEPRAAVLMQQLLEIKEKQIRLAEAQRVDALPPMEVDSNVPEVVMEEEDNAPSPLIIPESEEEEEMDLLEPWVPKGKRGFAIDPEKLRYRLQCTMKGYEYTL